MIRILIADDHAIVRSGLKQIIATTKDIVVAAEAAQGSEVIDKLCTTGLDLALLDMTMPGISGVELIRRVRAELPALPILMLSIHNDAQVVARALRAGATGYITKDSDLEILLAAIRKLARGGRFIDPALADAMIFQTRPGDGPPHERLSDRELQILRALATGNSINATADTFALSTKTVSTHKMRLMQKLSLANNAEMIRYAVRHGLVSE